MLENMQETSKIIVSVICPCYNELNHIAACLDSLLKQDYPMQHLEIIIADGMSSDGTRDILASYVAANANVRVIDNHDRIVATGFNRAIQVAQGEYIVRVDAHSDYPSNYVSTLLHYLQTLPKAENVGCCCETYPANDTALAKAIAIASSHPFGVGRSKFRLGIHKVEEVDTVPFGCWRKSWLVQMGGLDEDFACNEDDEFSARTIKAGGKIYLVPDIVVHYAARDTLSKHFKMYFQYGLFKPLVTRKLHRLATLRQLVPPLFIVALLGVWPIYLFIAILVSLPYKNVYLPLTFFCMHVGYGLGYWYGIYKIIVGQQFRMKSNH